MEYRYEYDKIHKKFKIVSYLTDKYIALFPDSIFYKLWENQELYDIQIFILDSNDLYLSLFEFSPKRIYDQINEKYYYDYMSEDEKNYFKGAGFKLLCGMLRYGISENIINVEDLIYTKATLLNYADSLLYDLPIKSSIEVTEELKSLVQYYERIGFQLTKAIDWRKEMEKDVDIKPLLSVKMYTSVKNIIRKC